VINRPRIKKGRIAFALSIDRPRAHKSGATVPGHAAGLEPLQRVAGAAELPAVNYVCSANHSPSGSNFTIGQIGGIMPALTRCRDPDTPGAPGDNRTFAAATIVT
jgi:hypothetical protein